jgi:ribosomal protein S18 acetylase RimI-like enzyme
MRKENSSADLATPAILRTNILPGDIGWIIHRHGVIYARERGFDARFEAYVAEPLGRMVRSQSPHERIWIAESGEKIVGCIAVVAASPLIAQLRWFFVEPEARGRGIGKQLLQRAVAFARQTGYDSIVLWTEKELVAAAHLYQSAGLTKVEERTSQEWGVEVVEEKYAMPLE